MKSGDRDIIAIRSKPAVERLLDAADNRPLSDTSMPRFAEAQFIKANQVWYDRRFSPVEKENN